MDRMDDLEDLLRTAEEASRRYDVEIYCAPRTRRERFWLWAYLFAGFALLALLVALPRWYWRLPCAVGFVALSWTFDYVTRLR